MSDNYSLLKNLAYSFAVLGDEEDRYKIIENFLKENNISSSYDNEGNLLCGDLQNPKVVVASHVDEIGIKIRGVREDGLLEIDTAGYIHPHTLLNSNIQFKTEHGFVNGYVLSGRMFGGGLSGYELKLEDLVVDVGALYVSEVLKLGIKVGTLGSYIKTYNETDTRIMTPGIDNCIGVYLNLMLALERRKGVIHLFHNGEEDGSKGARHFAEQHKYDYSLVLDYFPAKVIYERAGEIYPEIDKGPAVVYAAQDYKIHEKFPDLLEEVDRRIPSQKCFISKETEVGHFEVNGSAGVNLCVPARGFHGSNYIVSKSDIETTFLYAAELLKTLLSIV